MRALVTNTSAGGVRQGGSSITQQLAKNLFLTNERTIERKIKEAFLAMWLEYAADQERDPEALSRPRLSGRRRLRRGGGGAVLFRQVGARREPRRSRRCWPACSRRRRKYAPHINLPAARARANVVLDNMVEAGFMTEGQVFGARRNPAIAVDRRDDSSPDYYLDWAFDEMKEARRHLPERQCTSACSWSRTAIDMSVQRVAENAIENDAATIRPRLSREAGRHGGHRSRRRRARHGRRARLRREPVQPRHRRAAPAGFLVQALRLCDRADERLQADLDRGRRADLHRQLVPAELSAATTPAR